MQDCDWQHNVWVSCILWKISQGGLGESMGEGVAGASRTLGPRGQLGRKYGLVLRRGLAEYSGFLPAPKSGGRWLGEGLRVG